jgi:elongation factor Tu
MRVVDEYIPEPVRDVDKPFMMPVEDVFSIKGRGTVVTGRVDRGGSKWASRWSWWAAREEHELGGDGRGDVPQVAGRRHGRRQLRAAAARHQPDDVERGMVIAKPGSITPHTKFMSEVYVLRKEEGGRHKAFFTGYRPQFYIRTMDVTGNIKLPEGVEMVMPGDNVNLEVS